MSYHGIIPEAVYSISSVTTNKTKTFDTPSGSMVYKTIKPELFFGYQITQHDGKPVKIASPEKALLDFLYLTISTEPKMNLLNFVCHLRVYRCRNSNS